MIFDRLHHIKVQLENLNIQTQNQKQQQATDKINSIVDEYNEAIRLINIYIDYKNHQFMPPKPDTEIREMYDTAARAFNNAKTRLATIDNSFSNVTSAKNSMEKGMQTLSPQFKDQKDWLDEYMTKTKGKRKAMFYEKKISWFGIPLN